MLLVCSTVLASWSCARKTADAAPAAPQPSVAVDPLPPDPPSHPVSEPQTRASLPSPQPVPASAVPEVPGPLEDIDGQQTLERDPAPAPPKPVRRSPVTTAEVTPPAETPAPPVPQLGQIISEDQRRDYVRTIQANISRANELLGVVLNNSDRLNDEQRATVKRIRAFVQQAEEARPQDLAMAQNLADRAKLLAEDLARNLR